MSKICLIVIYNHNYEANIERIENLYKGKFSDIYHLIPFYTGNKENVIKVYGCAYQFNEYFQGLNKIKNDKYSHYVFVADDMILNPDFNENNIVEYLKLDDSSGFINNYEPITYEKIFRWDWTYSTLRHMFYNKSGCEYQKFIPTLEEAQKRFEAHGVNPKNITKTSLDKIQKLFVKDDFDYYRYDFSFRYKNGVGSFFSRLLLAFLRKFSLYPFNNYPKTTESFKKIYKQAPSDFVICNLRRKEKEDYTYPLAGGYSDFFVIPHKKMDEFLHLSSVFASIRVFVEIAIPTAMVLSLDKIVTGADVDFAPHFSTDEFAQQNEYSLNKLMENWDKKILFSHPVKLSKWKETYE